MMRHWDARASSGATEIHRKRLRSFGATFNSIRSSFSSDTLRSFYLKYIFIPVTIAVIVLLLLQSGSAALAMLLRLLQLLHGGVEGRVGDDAASGRRRYDAAIRHFIDRILEWVPVTTQVLRILKGKESE